MYILFFLSCYLEFYPDVSVGIPTACASGLFLLSCLLVLVCVSYQFYLVMLRTKFRYRI